MGRPVEQGRTFEEGGALANEEEYENWMISVIKPWMHHLVG